MHYRPFGSTGLDVSLLGFGGMRIPDKPPRDVADLLDRALELGVNYIDTAPGYGNSEELIGKALSGRDTEGIRRSERVIAVQVDAQPVVRVNGVAKDRSANVSRVASLMYAG